jgi:hypothetical protein
MRAAYKTGIAYAIQPVGVRATVQQGVEDIDGASPMQSGLLFSGGGVHIRAFLVECRSTTEPTVAF